MGNIRENFPHELCFRDPIPKNRWNAYQREVLAVAIQLYKKRWGAITKIFNHIFAEDLRSCGFENGLSYSTLVTQWMDLSRKSKLVKRSLQHAALANRVAQISRIIDASATALGIPSMRPDTMDVIMWPYSQPGPRHLERPQVATHPPLPLPLPLPSTPSGPRVQLTPPVTPRSRRPQQPRATPKFFFRAWNSRSQGINSPNYFTAGLWKENHQDIPDPRMCDSRLLDSLLRMHLSKCKVLSPVISLFETPLAAIHRAFLQGSGHVTVFKLSEFDSSRIFSAADVLRETPLHPEVSQTYFGISEWLIWGEINQTHIVTTIPTEAFDAIASQDLGIAAVLQLDTIKSHLLNRRPLKKQLASRNLKYDMETGQVIGRLLNWVGLKIDDAGPVAILFARSWRFQHSTDGHASFLLGVDRAYANIHLPSNDAPAASNEASQGSIDIDLATEDDTEIKEEEDVIEEVERRIFGVLASECSVEERSGNTAGASSNLSGQKRSESGNQPAVSHLQQAQDIPSELTAEADTNTPGRFAEDRNRVNRVLQG